MKRPLRYHPLFADDVLAALVAPVPNPASDAKRYQEHLVRKAIEAIDEND